MESETLTNQIIANRLVLVFSRSGLGKTSLLNAGVAERLRKEGFLPLPVRVNDTVEGPLRSVYEGIEENTKRQHVEYVAGTHISLWHYFKSVQFWREDLLLIPVLILDQFEELFSLQAEEKRRPFVDQLSYLVRGVRPTRIEDTGTKGAKANDGLNTSFSENSPVIRVVIAIREDFVGDLEDIADRIPQILDNRFRLRPLIRKAAAEAMEKPASVRDPIFSTRPFSFDQTAVNQVLDFLSHSASQEPSRIKGEIEPFQLQLVCQYVERLVNIKQMHSQSHIEVKPEDIGGSKTLSMLLKEFYQLQLQALSSRRERKAIRRLCEEYLISPNGRRLSVDQFEIERLLQIRPSTLQILVDSRLLRADHRLDSTYYELSHDSLVAPILKSRRLQFYLRGALLSVGAWFTLFYGSMLFLYGVLYPFFLRPLFQKNPLLGLGPPWIKDLIVILGMLGVGVLLIIGGRAIRRRAKERWQKARIYMIGKGH